MQGGRGAMSSVMEAAANVAASAKSGLDKTKAVIEEKAERMSTKDEVEKDMASLRKEEKIDLAELRKCKAYAQNAVAASAPSGALTPCFTDGGEFKTIGSYEQRVAEISSSNADNFVVEDVAGSQYCPVGSEYAAATAATNSGIQQAVDSNPTHTGMPAPVVEPDGVGSSGFGTQTNTGSGTHFATTN